VEQRFGRERLLTRADPVHLKAVTNQNPLDGSPDRLVVVDHEDPRPAGLA
jgi:hypothetical protein